jgi:signal transduction histidine kinase
MNAPPDGPYAFPMGRRGLGVATTAVAVAVSVASSVYVFGADGYVPGDPAPHPTVLSSLGLVAGLAAAVLLCWRHRRPVLVTGIALVPSLVLTSGAAAALIALAALAAARRDRVLWLGGALAYAATALTLWRDTTWHQDVRIAGTWLSADTTVATIVGVAVTAAVLTAIPVAVGVLRGTRADLRRREQRERELRDEVTRRKERSRIAHEMHDVLGHRLSLLSLQAGALEVTASPNAGDAARTLRTTARQSLEDLRQVIGVLRNDREVLTPDGAPSRPAPSLADVTTLVSETREAGVPVNLTVLLDQAPTAPAPLCLAVYRVVRESLTNVLRHAPGVAADVTVRGSPGAGVALEIVNPLVAARPSPGSGTGLTGISERVTALGGTVSIGRTGEHTFAVRAWLPWNSA